MNSIALHDAFVGKGMRGKRNRRSWPTEFLVPLVLSTRLIVRLLIHKSDWVKPPT